MKSDIDIITKINPDSSTRFVLNHIAIKIALIKKLVIMTRVFGKRFLNIKIAAYLPE